MHCRLFGSSCGLYPLDAIELVLAIKHLQILPNVSWGAKLPQLRTTAPNELNLKNFFLKNMFTGRYCFPSQLLHRHVGCLSWKEPWKSCGANHTFYR